MLPSLVPLTRLQMILLNREGSFALKRQPDKLEIAGFKSQPSRQIQDPMKYLALLLALVFTGCATNSGDAKKDARGRATNQALTEAGNVLGKMAVQALFSVAQQEAGGKGVDFQQAAASGLWMNVDAAQTGASIARIVDAYSGGKMTQTAVAAKQAFQGVQGDESNAAAISEIASVISTAAGAPPSK